MALIKPISLSIDAFDAKNPQTFYFTVSGGTQIVKNRLTIRDNLTNEIVYRNTIETFQFSQTVPSNTLKNNTYYNFYFNTFDIDDNMSEDSNVIQFYCYNTPTIYFYNLIEGQEIESSSFEFKAIYNSVDLELLNYIEFILYNSNNEEISRSPKYYGEVMMPQMFTHKFDGLENSNYSILVKGVTVNGTNISSELLNFTVRYYYPTIYSLLDLEQKCNEGYIQILSNIVTPDHQQSRDNLEYVKVFNVSNPQDYVKWETNYPSVENKISVWMEKTKLDIPFGDDFVKWYNGFRINNNFIIQMWLNPNIFGEICNIYDRKNKGNNFTLSFNRCIPYGETVAKDYVELKGYENGILKVYQRSNYVDVINSNSYYSLWFKKNGNSYELKIEIIDRNEERDILEWDVSNVRYGKITNLIWDGEGIYKEDSMPQYLSENIEEIFPLDCFEIKNGVYDNLDVTKNINKVYSTEFTDWNYDTVINCDFNGNINAGNIELTMSQLAYIKIKRRKKGDFNWITLYKIPVITEEDLNIILKDSIVASGSEYDYSFVPVLPDGTEGNYVTNTIKAVLNGTFISDQNKIFKLYSGVVLSTAKNQSVGSLQPINSKYPVLIKNGETDFVSGTVGGNILGYKFEETKVINRNDVVQQANDLENFLTDGDAKILTDQNGNCWLVRFNGMPSNVYNQVYGNGIISMSDTWIEQGNANSQEDLYNNGLLKDIE